ncbi:DUF6263 family protein [Flavobacterium okayamense]|uniref:Lipoprotein n=1 Tax=Flavobacterium okayamense TaxID=2830782 RepID=A0ABM7S7G1_9FLAO|nr:DUF6263 family protein [Flavobacterium okayamense]BCY28563.1 hypothetical protein KK2020170_14310 [Flavobacterium okayamense]
MKLKILILSVIFFTSCKEKYSYELNLTNGKTYRQKTIVDMDIEQEINGQEVDIRTRNAFEILYKVVKKTDSSMILRAQLISIYLKIDNPAQTIIFSTTDNDTTNVFNKIFKNMMNKDFTMEVAKNGEVLRVAKFENIFSKVFDNLPNISEPQKQSILVNLKQYYGEEAFKNMQLFGNNFYPKKEVALKDKWKSNNLLTNNELSLKSSTEMTLKKHKSKYAIITFDGNINTISKEDNVNPITLNGTTEGAYKIIPKTGWLKEATIYQNLKGYTETPINYGSSSVIKSPVKIYTKITVIGY